MAVYYQKIDTEISHDTIEDIARRIFSNNFLKKRPLILGHRYYLYVTGQRNRITREPNFMHTFKQKYGLQYIDVACLDKLEANKRRIINGILKNPFKVYNDFFANVRFFQKGEERSKRLTSFFTKLAHTVAPDQFSALDNPIRKYFHVNNESFFVSYCLINDTYVQWIKKNRRILRHLRQSIHSYDTDNALQVDALEDLKILDMIFWYKANRE
jgi:hypothetical protein